MNRGPFIFLGVFAIMALSWAVTLNKPIAEIGDLQPIGSGSDRRPLISADAAALGRELYQAHGCVACHTQQTRYPTGNDIERDWGSRRSVPRDYLGQEPAFLGFRRIGPDLSDVGSRRDDPMWHHIHFYRPESVSPGTIMPAYSSLYDTRPIVGEPSARALELPEGFQPGAGREVVPTRRAEALVAYMLSLAVDYDLPEAPDPEKVDLK